MEPPRSQTLGELVEEMAERFPQAPALIGAGVRSTWSDLARRVSHVAGGLSALGIGPGDRVAVMMVNRPEWAVVYLAAARIGAIFMGLNTWYQEEDAAYVLSHSGASALVCSERIFGRDLRTMVKAIRPSCPALRHVIVASETDTARDDSYERLERSEPAPLRPVDPAEPASILYTSGTTARPKGVVLHHRSLLENGFAIGRRQHLTTNDILWCGIPMFFSFFSANAMMALMTHGGAIVVQERFDAAEALDVIQEYRCTVYYGMPNMTRALAAEQGTRPRDIASLRTGLTIGSPEVIRLTASLVPGICNVYGLTETYGNCAVTDAREPLDVRASCQGALLPGFEMRVIDPEDQRCLDRGEPGLLCIRGRVTSGYYRDQQQTASAFDSNGFFLTGDFGYQDERGRVHYLGRAKEMIKTGGINVSPLEVEDVLLRHPAIWQAHVVAVPDPLRDEAPFAFIEWDPAIPFDATDVETYCRRTLPAYAVPRGYRLLAAADFPRTATGKVRKTELLKMLT
jgi:fatty-acyl-CoA synthase